MGFPCNQLVKVWYDPNLADFDDVLFHFIVSLLPDLSFDVQLYSKQILSLDMILLFPRVVVGIKGTKYLT